MRQPPIAHANDQLKSLRNEDLPEDWPHATPCPVRPALILALLTATPLFAAEKPVATPIPSRSQQLFGPIDQTRAFPVDQATSFGRSNATFNTKGAKTDSFYIQQGYQTKGYTNTHEFRSKGWWGGDFKFSTSQAQTKVFETNAATVKAAQVKEAREAGKSSASATREYAGAKKEGHMPGRSQALLDKEGPAAFGKAQQGWTGNLETLSVDDIKEILNKNK